MGRLPAAPPNVPFRAPDDPTPGSNRKLAWMLAGAVVVVGILLLTVFGGSDDETPVVPTPATDPMNATSELTTPSVSAPPTSSVLPSTP
ncbi:MAG TPA: hypothetical protein VGH89_42870, partial [Pseudonocardia sp.]